MTDLPRPDFIERDATVVESEAIALYESLTQKTLYPAQPERLLLNVLHYRETLMRLAIQDAAEQNLVNYARGVNLEHLGVLLGVTRLPASAARVTLRFTKDAGATALSVVVPAGTRAQNQDGITFATLEDLTIAGGSTFGDAIAEATVAGESTNGITAGKIVILVDPVSLVASVSNTTASNGGAAIESDDRLRARIKLAPNLFSTAGPTGAYIYWALTADNTIIDAAAINPYRGAVQIYVLTSTGNPSTEIRNKVLAVLNDEKIRPLTDQVSVLSPATTPFDFVANVVLYTSADAAVLATQLNAAAQAFVADKRAGLGRDVIASQAIAALSLPGVYSVTLPGWSDITCDSNEWANATSVTVNITGTTDG